MKALLTTVATLITVAAFGQGQVVFSNSSSSGWPNPTFDRLVHWDSTATNYNAALTPGDLVSSNYGGLNLSSLRAVLYYGASTSTDLITFIQAVGGSASFKPSTSATIGSWFPGTRTLQTIPNGTTANLVVVVWDSNVSADPLSMTAMNQGLWGRSAFFQYTPPTSSTPVPSEYLMFNLTAFTVGFGTPEPATLALAVLGAIGLFVSRRRG